MLKSTDNNFLGLDKKFYSLNNSSVVIVPFGMECGVSYGHGTAKAPEAIIRASQEVELFDEEFRNEPYQKFGIATLAPFKIAKKASKALNQLEKIITEILGVKKFPLILGGEHTLTAGAVKAIVKKYTPLTILHFDAHADLRDSYLGNKFSHACAMRRVFELGGQIKLVQVGIRNISNEKSDGGEYDFWRKNQNRITTFWAKDFYKFDEKRFLKGLGKNVYISFDVDALDPSIMPSTGTPEPGGLLWHDVVDLIKLAAKNSRIVGADIVELAPNKSLSAPDFLVAKLAYKILTYALNKN